MTCRPFPHPWTAAAGILAAIAFSTCAIAQGAEITVHVSAGNETLSFSMDIPATAAPSGAYQVPIGLDGRTWYMTEDGFERFTAFANRDDMTFSLSSLPPAETGPGIGTASADPRDRPGIVFDGVPIDVVFADRDTVAACRAICVEAPDCLAFTYHPGERQCDLFWDVYGEIPDACCVSGYLD